MKLASYNVNYLCQSPTKEQVLKNILSCGADVVCLQETNIKWQEYLESSDILCDVYPYRFFHNEENWNPWGGFAYLSKLPIHSKQVIPKVDSWWYAAGLVTIEWWGTHHHHHHNNRNEKSRANNGNNNNNSSLLQILNVHLRAPVIFRREKYWWGGHTNWVGRYFSQEVKNKRCQEIKQFMTAVDKKLPCIVLGDFNESPNGQSVSYLENDLSYTNVLKLKPSSCCGKADNTWQWPTTIPLLKFDYDHLVHCPKLKAQPDSAKVLKCSGSDHFLVSATFELKK